MGGHSLLRRLGRERGRKSRYRCKRVTWRGCSFQLKLRAALGPLQGRYGVSIVNSNVGREVTHRLSLQVLLSDLHFVLQAADEAFQILQLQLADVS